MQTRLVISFSIVSSLCLAQQQQLSNVMAFNNSNPPAQMISNNSRGNFSNFNTSNNRGTSNNLKIQTNKVKPKVVTSNNKPTTTNTVRQSNRTTNTNSVVRQRNRTNPVNVSGPNNRGDLANLNVNDNNVNTNEDNNLGNQFGNEQLLTENNANPIQSQQSVNVVEQDNKVSEVNNVKSNKSIDVSVNLNIRSFSSSSSSSSSSSKTNRRTFSKKYSKFKRHFLGKMASHKKSRHQVDICFNWK